MWCCRTHIAQASAPALLWGVTALGDVLDGPVSHRLCAALLTSYAAEASYRANPMTATGMRSWNSAGAEPAMSLHSLAAAPPCCVGCVHRLARPAGSAPSPAA